MMAKRNLNPGFYGKSGVCDEILVLKSLARKLIIGFSFKNFGQKSGILDLLEAFKILAKMLITMKFWPEIGLLLYTIQIY